jgi:hypothetical protein
MYGTEPEGVWKSQDEKEELSMTTDELCAKAQSQDRGNVVAHWTVTAVCVLLAAGFAYNVFAVSQPWIRLGQASIMGAILFLCGALLRRGPRRIQANEPCVKFLERSIEGKREGALEIRRVLFLLIPGIAACWWGGGPAAKVTALGIHPSSWLFQFASGPWPFLAVGLALAFVWFAFGTIAEKASQELKGIRRSLQS